MSKEERIKLFNEFMKYEKPLFQIEVDQLDELGFFTAPASIMYHGAYEGGLFDHSLATAKALVNLTEKLGLTWERECSPYIVGMYHDLCKCDNYVKEPFEDKYTYNSEIVIPGHGDKSVIMLSQYMPLNDEEIACIRWHMGAYEKDTRMWEYFGRAIEKYPNVLYTHTADMIASKIEGV